ncbi:phage portal protein [Diaphorobacter caeni]|uniref:phage portal protein n=1 Tax=Diaphorobacter caeni TaxID=2784387 RepID=UPI00189060AD|nr:phage portal protein [Diaphorobacter caeni]MBF5006001.1 phage portal protein [Diaphorobacter caeni]
MSKSARRIKKEQAKGYVSNARGGWIPSIAEPFSGAWQRNIEWSSETVLAFHAVYACVTRIAQDIGKLRIKLVRQDVHGIWNEVEASAYNVLKKPNHYQNRIQFLEQWQLSKLIKGNAYILKEYDDRSVVRKMYVLNPATVKPLVTHGGDVYYELGSDDLNRINETKTVPASMVIHDRMNCLFHPLVGVSPIYAAGMSAAHGQALIEDASRFAKNGSTPGGFLTAPTRISDETATRLKKHFDENYAGENRNKIAVLGDGLKYEPVRMSAADAKVIEQLGMTAKTVCSVFHVPAYMVGIGDEPKYGKTADIFRTYYSQCLQSPIEALELCLDEGLGLNMAGNPYGTELDLDGLIRLDEETKVQIAKDGVGAGVVAPDEARKKLNLGPVAGGATPYMQQQNFSLAALDKRDTAEQTPQPSPSASAEDMAKAFASALDRKFTEGMHA